MSGRYTFFTDATNTTRYRFSTTIDFFNAVIDAINRGECGINPNINDNSTTSNYINRANLGSGQVLFDRGASDPVNNTLEICFDQMLSATGTSYFNQQVGDASSKGWLFGSIVGAFSMGMFFMIAISVIRCITERAQPDVETEAQLNK